MFTSAYIKDGVGKISQTEDVCYLLSYLGKLYGHYIQVDLVLQVQSKSNSN